MSLPLLVLQSGDLIVLGRVLFSDKMRKRPSRGIATRLEKEHTGVSLRQDALVRGLPGRGRRDLVHASWHHTISPPLHGVTDIDNHLALLAEACWQYGHEGPRQGPVLELEPAAVVLEQQRDNAKVGMRPRALNAAACETHERRWWVVVQA